MMDTKIHRWASVCIIAASIVLVAYFAVDYLLAAILPFLLAWATAFALRPLSRKIASKTGLSDRIIRLLLSMLASVAIISGIVAILWYIVNKSWQFLSNINQNDGFISFLKSFLDGGFFSKFIYGEELLEYIEGAIRSISSGLLEKLADAISALALKLPGVFIFMLVTVISAAYFAYELERVNAFVLRALPSSATRFLRKLKRGFSSVGVRYVRSYLIIMSVTFASLLIGFLIIRIEYAVLIALFVAVLDILPVFGIGTVLVPWSLMSFVMGNAARGVGLLLLFLFITILREIVEPKILGKNLGLHPLLTLILLYVGYYFFGFLGMIILPPLGALVSVLFKGEGEKVG